MAKPKAVFRKAQKAKPKATKTPRTKGATYGSAAEEAAATIAAATADETLQRERRIVKLYRRWDVLREALVAERKQQNERVAAAEARLRVVVEDGTATGDRAGRLAKLTAIETEWQALDEARAERTEAIKAAKQDLDAAEVRLREAVDNSSQLDLFANVEGASGDASE